MPNLNPDELYHKASHGRLQNTENEADSYDQIHFISREVEGSKESLRSRKLIRDATVARLDDRLRFFLVALGTLGATFVALDIWVGSKAGFPLFGILADIFLGLLGLFIIYYAIRNISLKVQDRKDRKKLNK